MQQNSGKVVFDLLSMMYFITNPPLVKVVGLLKGEKGFGSSILLLFTRFFNRVLFKILTSKHLSVSVKRLKESKKGVSC